MEREPLIELIWHGRATIEAVKKLLNQTEQIEIELPDNYNHSLFRALHPDASAGELEDIDDSGGPELLTDIATVSGLEELAELIGALTAARASVQIVSPPKLVISIPTADSVPE